jgi:hypothetical protein
MTVKRHPSSRTNAKLRKRIRESPESDRALALKLGLNRKTIAKWRSRPTTSDARRGPTHPVSTLLDAAEEALIVLFRKRTRLPLDECLKRLKPMVPRLSRSSLHRCFRRYGVSTIPKGRAQKPIEDDDRPSSPFFMLEIHAVRGYPGHYLYSAICSLSRFVFAEFLAVPFERAGARFLSQLIKNAPIRVEAVRTNNHPTFVASGQPSPDSDSEIQPHLFREIRLNHQVRHSVIRTKDPTPKMIQKGWRDVAWPKGPKKRPYKNRGSKADAKMDLMHRKYVLKEPQTTECEPETRLPRFETVIEPQDRRIWALLNKSIRRRRK